MKKIIFICRGNMFRSPIAKALFNQNPAPGWHAESYGTAVQAEGRQGIQLSQWGLGIQMTIAEMKKHDLDISNEFCNQILPEYITDNDKIIMMSEKEFIPEWLHTYQWEYWEVPNPDFLTEEIIEEVIVLLSKNIEKLKKSCTYFAPNLPARPLAGDDAPDLLDCTQSV